MTPPRNRYDKLNELSEAGRAEPIFTEEAWVQAPDGSWVRPTDKAARKQGRKPKRKDEPEPVRAAEPAPAPPAPAAEPKRRLNRKPEPEPVQAVVFPEPLSTAEPKRRFGFRSSAEKTADRQRQAELEQQAVFDREAEQRRRVEAEQERLADLERKAQEERERAAELQRRVEFERSRVVELEREVELERQRQADLAREVGYERQRQVELERERDRQAELDRSFELDRRLAADRSDEPSGSYWREPDADYLSTRWPDNSNDLPAEPDRRSLSDTWLEARHTSSAKSKRTLTAGRRPGAGQRMVGTATAVGLVIAALVVGAGIKWLGPDPDRAQRPFISSGQQGESLDVRTFTITVQTARAVAVIQAGSPSAQDTQGAWIIVRVRLVAVHEPARVGYVALQDEQGRTYLASDRITQPLLDGKRTFQPGIPMEGEVVFEVPKDALNGLTAHFAADPDQLALDAMAEIDLPALSIIADQTPATLAATEVRP